MARDEDVDDLVRRRNEQFIATLSRELRSPLAPLRYALNVLRTQPSDEATSVRARTVMERQVDKLVRLVDDLLELSRVNSDSFAPLREHIDLAGVVTNAIERTDARMRVGGHTLELEMPQSAVWIEGDPVGLVQILANLLDNAARFTDRGGRITLNARVEGDRVVITVRDTGRGFAPELSAQFFETFRENERSIGLGIGLALARRLTELHHGTIVARSEGAGRGAEFVVTLPLAAMPERRVARGTGVETAIVPCRILIADDNRDAADTLADIMRDLGGDVVAVVYDGGAAVAAAREHQPDLALLDIGMPVLDGYEVARQIRRDAGSRSLTLVALTGWGQADDRLRAKDAGFDEHLVKPATFEALRALLPLATR
jgi:CheY-like chemotaxis protein